MDESWRMRMGMMPSPPPTRHRPSYQFPRPSADAASRRREPVSDSDDFSDVFGGPPRTVLSRQFSSGLPRSSSSASYFYEEIFQPAAEPARRSGRSLPAFRIPGRRERDGFYSDIFGCEDERVVRSRSRSKTSSSSVLSSEELSPLRPAFSVDGDDDVSSFASKLRPINVRSMWDSTKTENEDHYQRQQNTIPPFSNNQSFQTTENYAYFGSNRRYASPETISLEPISNSSFIVSADDMEPNSPSSPVSSVCHSLGRKGKGRELDDDDEEVSRPDDRSYVIEINSEKREGTCESNGVDEAIAWAKEKFQTHYCDSVQECDAEKTTQSLNMLNGHQVSEGHSDSFGSLDNQQVKWEIVEEEELLECRQVQTEMDTLDEKIRLWSAGNEADIRLLLSSLHHILWPSSGWLPAPMASLIEASRVKKAYQKARLCLHPDKLQQRGATVQQKYVAEKAFSIFQDAWAAFISLDVL